MLVNVAKTLSSLTHMPNAMSKYKTIGQYTKFILWQETTQSK